MHDAIRVQDFKVQEARQTAKRLNIVLSISLQGLALRGLASERTFQPPPIK
jgi:hypothetical protein